jgi:hypothetical protein
LLSGNLIEFVFFCDKILEKRFLLSQCGDKSLKLCSAWYNIFFIKVCDHTTGGHHVLIGRRRRVRKASVVKGAFIHVLAEGGRKEEKEKL